ncbi:serine/threonine-protein kinase [Lentzea aerocolonigenes]|uniref:serine/threonine-protein kinase n=1 Tax=Lentzea aerocolonigenes TaxID=68170 RepID=UPI0009E60334|nr:serine/threonine-protein kinase [Lentzea aerocolonigenes]
MDKSWSSAIEWFNPIRGRLWLDLTAWSPYRVSCTLNHTNWWSIVSASDLLGDHPRHDQKAYRLGHRPLGRGGQAEVYPAEHKATGVQVALKRRRSWNVEAVARMQREIEFGQLLPGNDHIMPVLDFGLKHDWFVMPLAHGNAEDARSSLLDDAALTTLVLAVCSALEAAHDEGWLHRDLKPANILLVDGRWTVADWGLGRRPRGDTTFTGRTKTGEFLGSEGFAAPEQATDAHRATACADLYSLGQIIGWARTSRTPKQGSPLVPDEEPWRSVVIAATRKEPAARLQTAREFREIMNVRTRRA